MLECVINLSEGRSADRLSELAASAGAALLDVHSDAVHNRSVFTLCNGDPETVEASAHALATRAVEVLDLREHRGIHPRLGVVDVVPFVPLGGTGMEEAVAARDRFVTFFAAAGVPCFTYGPEPPGTPERTLPELRRSAFSTLAPTAGPPVPHETAGGCCVGARPVLVAYNVLIEGDVEEARAIARQLRSPVLRTLGLDFGGVGQVSFNLIAPYEAGPADAYDLVARHAVVTGAELVGLLPADILHRIAPERWHELDSLGGTDDRVAPRLGRRSRLRGGVRLLLGEHAGAADTPALTLAHAAPDAELLAVGYGVVEALLPHDAPPAHLFRLSRGGAPLREEQVGIDTHAVGAALPGSVRSLENH